MRGSTYGAFALLCSVLCLLLATHAAYAEDDGAATEGQLVEKVSTPEKTPNNHVGEGFKATVSSLYLNLTGTRPAYDHSYGFGQASITAESLAVEYEIITGTKAYVRGQYLTNEYTVMAGGKAYDETTQGMGDTLLGVNQTLFSRGGFTLLGDAGVYVPTGSINANNPYMTGTADPHYKYYVQLGSGTVDETFGLTALYKQSFYRLGWNGKTVLRNYDNDEHYRDGSLYETAGWLDVPLKYGFAPRLSAAYHAKSGMKGEDPDIIRSAAEIYYHDMIDWNVSISLRYSVPVGKVASLVAEVGAPVAQGMTNSDDVKLDTNFFGTLSASGTF